jgi:hypothetical protein
MTSLEAALRAVDTDFTDSGVRFALVGGLAVSVRTEPRFTRDADFAVAVQSDIEAEDVIRQFRLRRYHIQAMVEQDAVGRLATVRLTRGNDEPVVDLLFASSGIEREVVADAEALELLPKLTLPVARTGHLIALKILSRDDDERPQDLADLRALLRVATPIELQRARDAVALIASRGYHRGRDVVVELNRMTTSTP